MDKMERKAIRSLLEYDSEEFNLPSPWDQMTPVQKKMVYHLPEKKVTLPVKPRNRAKLLSVDQIPRSQIFERIDLPPLKQPETQFQDVLDGLLSSIQEVSKLKEQARPNKFSFRQGNLRFSSIMLNERRDIDLPLRKIKGNSPEILIQDTRSQKPLKLSELCKDIMICRPLPGHPYPLLPRIKKKCYC